MENLEKLNNAIKDLEEQSNDLKEFNKVYSEIAKLKSDIKDNLKLLREYNKGFESISVNINDNLENSKKQFENLESDLLKKINELYRDNKNFQKELDSSINSRLEKNKSDIQVEIRNEGIQIQRTFENIITSSFNNMDSTLNEYFQAQEQDLINLKHLFYLVIAILIGLIIGLFVL